jgi:hypothetical protein
VGPECGVINVNSTPDARNQILTAHQIAASFNQSEQDFEGAGADRDRRFLVEDLSFEAIQAQASETEHNVFRDGLIGRPLTRQCRHRPLATPQQFFATRNMLLGAIRL